MANERDGTTTGTPGDDEPRVEMNDLEPDADPKGGPTEELFGNYNFFQGSDGGAIKPKGSVMPDGG